MSVVAHLAVSDRRHDHPQMHLLAEQQSRGSVAAVGQPDVPDTPPGGVVELGSRRPVGFVVVGRSEAWDGTGGS